LNNTKEPLISVIVPIYNVEEYLPKCINSIISQQYKNLEIILVNDGATDLSGKIADNYAKKDNRIIVIHQKNQGLSAARNSGIDVATGEFIGFVDSDDWIEKSMYSSLYADLAANDADISICGYVSVDKNEKYLRHCTNIPSICDNGKFLPNGLLVYESQESIMKYCTAHRYGAPWCMLYKRELFENVRFPLNKIYEDFYIMHLIMDKANKLVINPKRRYNYLKRSHSISQNSSFQKEFDLLDAYVCQYVYILEKHPDLVNFTLRRFYDQAYLTIKNIFLTGSLNQYKQKMDSLLKIMRNYPPPVDDMSCESKKYLTLLRSDMKYFVMAGRLMVQSGEWKVTG